MDIAKLSAKDSVRIEDLKKIGRKIKTEAGDPLFLVNLDVGGRTAGVLLYAPEGAEYAEFVCTGQNGVWMRDEAAYEYIMERNSLADEGRRPAVSGSVSTEVLENALLHGFRIVASPLGDMEMTRVGDDCELSVSHLAWSEVEADAPAPSVDGSGWYVSRLDRGDQGGVYVAEALSLNDAIASSYLLDDEIFASRSTELNNLTFESLDNLTDFAGPLPEFVTGDDEVSPSVAQEFEMDEGRLPAVGM